MDMEIKAALTELAAGQARLGEELARSDERMDKLIEQVARSAALMNAMAEGQALLTKRMENVAEGQVAILKSLEKMGARVDSHNETVLRGFTDAGARGLVIERRIDSIEARLSALEQDGHT